MSDLLQRKGIIKITDDLIRKEPENVLKVLKDLLVVRIDDDFMTRSLTYMAYSKHFDLCNEGEHVPTYMATITTIHSNQTGDIDVKWNREKEYSEKSVKYMLLDLKESLINQRKEIETNLDKLKT